MFDSETRSAAKRWATRLGVETAVILAVIEVESAGKVYAIIGKRKEPLIRFEGHYFDRRLSGNARSRARAAGLSNPVAGGVRNAASQEARWRLLNRAIRIDAKAALESTSWGFGQVMGAHWHRLGYASVEELVNTARAGASGQLDLMGRYIEAFALVEPLKRRDWAAFARGYNGPAFESNGYHRKLAAAYRRHSAGSTTNLTTSADGMLRLGSNGSRVRELQTLLVRAGYALTIDGDFGPATDAAVRNLQKHADLEIDGVAGPQTMRALDQFRQGKNDQPGKRSTKDIPEVRDGLAGGLGGGVAIEIMRQQVMTAADRLSFIPGLEWASSGLSVLAAMMVIGGLAFAVWGWWRSGRTVERPT